jgi:signal transduction histidine kinase
MSDRVNEYLHIITTSAANMSGMVERLLDYARIGAGAPAFERVDLRECLDRARDLLIGEIEAAACKMHIDELPTVKGDKLLLVRLFQNLIVNSLKYRRPETPAEIYISSTTKGDWVDIAFQDNGIGIKTSDAGNLFKMFSRLHSDAEYSGHGMGLAICKRVCEIHHGSIGLDIDGPQTGGARFIIRLPQAERMFISKDVTP